MSEEDAVAYFVRSLWALEWAFAFPHKWTDGYTMFPAKNIILALFKASPDQIPKRLHIRAGSTKAVPHAEFGTGKRVGYAAFPRRIPQAAIKAHCPPGGVVLDPFMGQGVTLEVAQKMGRRAIGIEIAPEMCEYVRERQEAKS